MEAALLEDPPSAHLGWCVCHSLPGHFPNLSCVEYRSLLTQVAALAGCRIGVLKLAVALLRLQECLTACLGTSSHLHSESERLEGRVEERGVYKLHIVP